jgi:hypothetical protein
MSWFSCGNLGDPEFADFQRHVATMIKSRKSGSFISLAPFLMSYLSVGSFSVLNVEMLCRRNILAFSQSRVWPPKNPIHNRPFQFGSRSIADIILDGFDPIPFFGCRMQLALDQNSIIVTQLFRFSISEVPRL